MWVWIIVGIVFVAIALWSFWPRRRGIDDVELRRQHNITKGSTEKFRPPNPPGGWGSTF